ncbi:MAG: rRNA maturation RNAse YbeY, partial [Desulfonatronovibrionaceae bacterium]
MNLINVLADSFPCLTLPVSLREIKDLAETILTGLAAGSANLDILITGDRAMKDYNFRFLGLKSTTNVLSFPQNEDEQQGLRG